MVAEPVVSETERDGVGDVDETLPPLLEL